MILACRKAEKGAMTSENIYEELILLFKRFVTVCLAVLLMAGAMFVAMPGAQAVVQPGLAAAGFPGVFR